MHNTDALIQAVKREEARLRVLQAMMAEHARAQERAEQRYNMLLFLVSKTIQLLGDVPTQKPVEAGWVGTRTALLHQFQRFFEEDRAIDQEDAHHATTGK